MSDTCGPTSPGTTWAVSFTRHALSRSFPSNRCDFSAMATPSRVAVSDAKSGRVDGVDVQPGHLEAVAAVARHQHLRGRYVIAAERMTQLVCVRAGLLQRLVRLVVGDQTDPNDVVGVAD